MENVKLLHQLKLLKIKPSQCKKKKTAAKRKTTIMYTNHGI